MTRERAGTRTVWGRKSDGTQGAVARMKGRVWQGQRPLQGQQRMDAERRGRPQPSILSALRFVPTGSTAPPPSWEQGPQDRRHQHPVTPVFRRPGEGHGALYDFLVSCVFRRFRSLRSMGLKVFRPGLGTFSTYSSTRPLSPPDSWLRRSRSTPCQAS